MEFMNACKRVFNDVSNKLGVSVDVTSVDVTESVPDLGPITFCDQYLFGLLVSTFTLLCHLRLMLITYKLISSCCLYFL
jgi:hypothetical protein